MPGRSYHLSDFISSVHHEATQFAVAATNQKGSMNYFVLRGRSYRELGRFTVHSVQMKSDE